MITIRFSTSMPTRIQQELDFGIKEIEKQSRGHAHATYRKISENEFELNISHAIENRVNNWMLKKVFIDNLKKFDKGAKILS